jgi:type I restriction enzyme S subunit
MRKNVLKNNWREIKLGELCEINIGQSPPSSSYNCEGDGLHFYQGVRDLGDSFHSVFLYYLNYT